MSDFEVINRDRKHIEQMVRYIDICVEGVTESHVAGPHQADRRTEEPQSRFAAIKQLASGMRQDFDDTFQLFIGVLSVLDSAVSKKQAQRSTALTVLAAIYLPFSLATGVYGMNTKEINMGAPKWWAVLALGIGLCVITCLIVAWVMFRDRFRSVKGPIGNAGAWDVVALEKGV